METMLYYLGSRKILAVTLEVQEHNRAALAPLYEIQFLAPEGRRKNYYQRSGRGLP